MLEKIGLGGSCHWCTEAIFDSLAGVEKVEQGWIQSDGENTDFSEAVIVHFNSTQISLNSLIEIHLHTHSCTSNHSMRNKYRSAVYYFAEPQKKQSLKILQALQIDFEHIIITRVLQFIQFKLNKEDQLNYYYSDPEKPFCKNVIDPKLKILLQRFCKKIKPDNLLHLKTSVLCLGTAAIGRPLYINIKQEAKPEKEEFDLALFMQDGLKFLEQSYVNGIRHFDSSPGYGIAEDLLIEFLKNKTEEISVSTKWGYTYVANFDKNATRHELKEHSLAKLNEQWEKSKQLLPHLNLYQIHSVTAESAVLDDEKILERLYEIKTTNHIEIGLSTSGAFQNEVIRKAVNIKVNGQELFSSFQVTFNLLDQSLLQIKDTVSRHKLIIKEAMANGRVLSNKSAQYKSLQKYLAILAQKYQVGADAVALRFCMDSFKGSIVLSGATNEEQLLQNLKANGFKLTKQELEKLREFAIEPASYWQERKELNWN